MIKNVVFDIGNVLVDFRWRELMKNLNLSKEAQDRFETSVFGSCWWHDLDHGTIDEKDAVIRLREDNIEFREAFDLVWENRDKLVKPYDYAVSWIDSLKEQGYHVYLLSNYPRDIFTLHANIGSFPFLDHVDGKIVSGFVQMIKPDADIYEKLIKGYTEKQWGRKCDQLPAFIIKRLPVRLTFDNNYFNALYQGIPVGGYTKMVANMLDGIEVRLDEDYLERKEEYDQMAKKVIYTGPIDAYFEYKLGSLEYRSVRFENETLNIPNFQGNAAVNYTDAETPWTRIIEHKWFEFGKDEEGSELPKTVISREYSSEWKLGDEPYYPVNDEKNGELYQKYKELARNETKVIFGGRLGEYKYYDMDAVILSALVLSGQEL